MERPLNCPGRPWPWTEISVSIHQMLVLAELAGEGNVNRTNLQTVLGVTCKQDQPRADRLEGI